MNLLTLLNLNRLQYFLRFWLFDYFRSLLLRIWHFILNLRNNFWWFLLFWNFSLSFFLTAEIQFFKSLFNHLPQFQKVHTGENILWLWKILPQSFPQLFFITILKLFKLLNRILLDSFLRFFDLFTLFLSISTFLHRLRLLRFSLFLNKINLLCLSGNLNLFLFWYASLYFLCSLQTHRKEVDVHLSPDHVVNLHYFFRRSIVDVQSQLRNIVNNDFLDIWDIAVTISFDLRPFSFFKSRCLFLLNLWNNFRLFSFFWAFNHRMNL